MSGEQSKRLDALLESVTNSVSKMEVPYMFPPFLRMVLLCYLRYRGSDDFHWSTRTLNKSGKQNIILGDFLFLFRQRAAEENYKKVDAAVLEINNTALPCVDKLLDPILASVHIWFGICQGFGSVFIWYGSGSRVFITTNWKKFTAEKNLIFCGAKITIYLSLGLHKGRPSYKRSLQLSKENIQHFKTWNFLNFFYFCGSFLPSSGSGFRIRIRIHWPDWIPILI